jgi:imidazolonepropionase
MAKHCELLIKNVRIASMQDNNLPYGSIENAILAINDGVIVYVGENSEAYSGEQCYDGQNRWLLPGLIDCHTHLIYGGNRATEFEQRLQGISYTEIAQQGGGIQSTVNATRKASKAELLTSAIKRAARLVEEGVTSIEIKSGYGLDLDTEIKMLEIARELAQQLPINIIPTYLGAHTVPVEYKDKPDEYVSFICQQVIPEIAKRKLAVAVDVFCESIGFSPKQCERVFIAAKQHGLGIKAHVEQLSDLKGAKLAADFGAWSVDHIEYLDPSDVSALKEADTVAVLLPGAFYFLNETKKPPVAALREHNVPMAVATDLNPGSSPLASLLTAMNMASVLFGLTPEEALRGTTINAAKALGLENKGTIKQGMDADLCLWDIEHPSELVYGINQNRPCAIWLGGRHV